jgi:hypothetical protein
MPLIGVVSGREAGAVNAGARIPGRQRSILWLLVTVATACTSSPKPGLTTGPSPSGVLAVQVAGLPSGTGARVTVIGPGGYTRTLSASGSLTGLGVGTYHVSAGFVNAQGLTWTGVSAPDSAYVAAGDTVPVVVTYTGGPATSINLTIAGVTLVQSTQRADNSVPMVANRDALLRVFVLANAANSATPIVRVRLFSGGAQVDSLDVAASVSAVPQAVDTSSLAGSWNVLIPAARLQPGLSFQAVVDPDNAIPETSKTDNSWPSSGTQAVTVQSVPAFNLLFVPVKQSVNGLTGNVSASNKDALAAITHSIYPLSAMTVNVRSLYTTSAPALDANNTSGAWGTILNETSALQTADGSSADYVSIVATSYSSGIAGLGWIGAPAAVAWDKAGSAPGVIAHEIGHNFGRLHAPCGNPSNPDPSYPYSAALIGTWGIDLGSLTLMAPSANTDLMSYCHPQWISDYTYVGVLSFRGTGPDQQPGPAPGPGLLIWGRIQNGSVVLEPAFVVNAPARLPSHPGPHRVEGFDAGGSQVFALSFEGEVVPDLPQGEERQFAYVVPLAATDRARLAGLRLVGNGLTAMRLPFAGLRSGQAPPAPTATATRRGNEVEVQWDPAYPMAIVRDARTGEILSFARNGLVRVPAGSAGVRVELSEGVTSQPVVTIVRP